MLATSTPRPSCPVCHIYISSCAFILQSTHTFVVFSYKRPQRCCRVAVARSNCLSACLCVLTGALLDPYRCCNLNLAASTVSPVLPRDTKFGGGGRVVERQMMDMMDRHKRALGEKMVSLLLIILALMIKRVRSPLLVRNKRFQLPRIVLHEAAFWLSQPVICSAAQTCRLTLFWWLALAGQLSI